MTAQELDDRYLEFVEQIRSRKRRRVYGILTADRYLSDLPKDLDNQDWSKELESARFKLTYSDPKTRVKRSSVSREDGPVLMTFDARITTPRQDRDGDILETKHAIVDERMPLLWQHITMQPIGRFVRTIAHTPDFLDGRFELADIPLGNDAATLVEMGALRISHGFMPDMEHLRSLEDGGFYFGRFTIFETSLVSVPSNVDAIITAYSRQKLVDPLMCAWAKRMFDNRPVQVAGVSVKPGRKRKRRKSSKEPATQPIDVTVHVKAGQVSSVSKSQQAASARAEVPESREQKEHMPPIVGPIVGTMEWTQNALQKASHEWLKSHSKAREGDGTILLATWQDSAVVCCVGYDRPWEDDECFKGSWAISDESGLPEWIGEPIQVQIEASLVERSFNLMHEAGWYKGVRDSARTPTFSGVEMTSWSKPSLADYRAGLDLPDDAQWSDLTSEQKSRIVAHTLIGQASADTFAEANAFPVVNPRTHHLNQNALRNAISRAPQASIPASTAESIQRVARRLLEAEFPDDRSYEEVERSLLALSLDQDYETLNRTVRCLSKLVSSKAPPSDAEELETLLFGESQEMEFSKSLKLSKEQTKTLLFGNEQGGSG